MNRRKRRESWQRNFQLSTATAQAGVSMDGLSDRTTNNAHDVSKWRIEIDRVVLVDMGAISPSQLRTMLSQALETRLISHQGPLLTTHNVRVYRTVASSLSSQASVPGIAGTVADVVLFCLTNSPSHQTPSAVGREHLPLVSPSLARPKP